MTTDINSLCCYDGCTSPATTTDHEGDAACERCAAREGRRYEITADLAGGEWVDADLAEKVQAALASDGWDVTIRAPRRGEALATYERSVGGDLQILGYSIPVPEALNEAVEKARNASL